MSNDRSIVDVGAPSMTLGTDADRHERVRQYLIERIRARAIHLRRRAEREIAGVVSDLRLALALEEATERLEAVGFEMEDFSALQLAAGIFGQVLGLSAQVAEEQLRQQGAKLDIFLPHSPEPDEARVLQVLLRLRPIPRLKGNAAVEVIRKALSPSPEGSGPS